MKFIEGYIPTVELTERNLLTLLDKLGDPGSERTLLDGERKIFVKAVPDSEHYKTREPGPMFTNGEWK